MTETALEPDAPLPPEEAARLKRKARIGAIALALRTVALQLTVFGGMIALARLLDPADFGAFSIVQYALSFFTFFGDVGLAGALVRQKEEPTETQLATVFFVQLGLALSIFVIVSIAAGFVRHVWPSLPEAAPWVMRALALDLLLTAFRVVPSILLERALEFPKLAVVEVVLSVSFYVVTVTLAALGFRVWALAAGAVAQGVVSLVAMMILRPWRPRLAFDGKGLGALLRYGLAVQGKNLVGLVNGAITPVYAGAALGAAKVGYINWAQNTAYMPLKVVEILARVNFPLYARMQSDKKLFAATLGRSIQISAIAVFAMVAGFLSLGANIIEIVYTGKWLPALPLLYVYACAISVGFFAPIVGPALDAAGKPGVFFRLSIGWTLLNWAVVLTCTPRFGLMGYVAGYVVHVVVGNAAVVLAVKRILPDTKVVANLAGPAVACAVTTLVARAAVAPWVHGPVTLVLGVIVAAAVFAGALVAVDRRVVGEVRAFARREA